MWVDPIGSCDGELPTVEIPEQEVTGELVVRGKHRFLITGEGRILAYISDRRLREIHRTVRAAWESSNIINQLSQQVDFLLDEREEEE